MAINKVIVALVLVLVLVACCVQATFGPLGYLGDGEEGYYKRCFVKLSLSQLANGYQRERVVDELGGLEKRLEAELDSRFKRDGGSKECSEECFNYLVQPEPPSSIPGEQELTVAQCERFAKMKHLCTLIKKEKFGDIRKITIEKWLCQTSKQLEDRLYQGYFKCRDVKGYPNTFWEEAEKTLETVLAYTSEQLEEERQKVGGEIETNAKLREEFDGKMREEAFSKIHKGALKDHKFMQCSKEEKEKKAREEERQAKEREREEKRNRYEDDYTGGSGTRQDDRSGELATMGFLALAGLGASS